MTFFLREPPAVDQPQEVIYLVPGSFGGFMVCSFDYNHFTGKYDQAVPLLVEDLESARTCVPEFAEEWPVPPEIGAVECWVSR